MKHLNLFDIRLVDKYIRKNKLNEKEYTKFLGDLKDCSNQATTLSIEPLVEEEWPKKESLIVND